MSNGIERGQSFLDQAAERMREKSPSLISRDEKKSSCGDSTCIDWPEPKPIQTTLHPVPAFDPETLLPDTLRAWIMDEAERMPCPPDFVAAAVLVSIGSIIGARCAIKPKSRDSWLIVPNLWGGIVGLPSAKKSPAIGSALKPLDRLIAQAMDAHKEKMEAFESDKMVSDAKKDAIESRIKAAAKDSKKGDLNSIARELKNLRQETPEEPTLRRYKSNCVFRSIVTGRFGGT